MDKGKLEFTDDGGDKKYFTIIPNYVLNHSTHWDREVYMQMKRIAGDSKTCWTSRSTLARQCGMSINRLAKSTEYLIKNEWIKKIGQKLVETRGGIQYVNEYKIIDLWKKNIEFYEQQGRSPEEQPIKQGRSRARAKVGHQTTSNNITINKNPISDETSRKVVSLIDLFKTVNPSYSRLFGNKTERAAAERLIKQHSYEKLEPLLIALPGIIMQPYAPKITTPWELERFFGKLILFVEQHKQINQTKIAFS